MDKSNMLQLISKATNTYAISYWYDKICCILTTLVVLFEKTKQQKNL